MEAGRQENGRQGEWETRRRGDKETRGQRGVREVEMRREAMIYKGRFTRDDLQFRNGLLTTDH